MAMEAVAVTIILLIFHRLETKLNLFGWFLLKLQFLPHGLLILQHLNRMLLITRRSSLRELDSQIVRCSFLLLSWLLFGWVHCRERKTIFCSVWCIWLKLFVHLAKVRELILVCIHHLRGNKNLHWNCRTYSSCLV